MDLTIPLVGRTLIFRWPNRAFLVNLLGAKNLRFICNLGRVLRAHRGDLHPSIDRKAPKNGWDDGKDDSLNTRPNEDRHRLQAIELDEVTPKNRVHDQQPRSAIHMVLTILR